MGSGHPRQFPLFGLKETLYPVEFRDMRKSVQNAGFIALCLVAAAIPSQAALVKLVYTATVATVAGTPFGFDTTVRNATMTGYFLYDTSTPPVPPPGTTSNNFDQALPVAGFYGVVNGVKFRGSNIEQAQMVLGPPDTFRIIDGPDAQHPGRILSVNGVPNAAATLFFAIVNQTSVSSTPSLPAVFPFPWTDAHTFALADSNGTLLMQFTGPLVQTTFTAVTTNVTGSSGVVYTGGTTGNSTVLTASVTSDYTSSVNGGTVNFVIPGVTSVLNAAVTNGTATATINVPPGTPPGIYPIQTTYSGTSYFSGSTDTTSQTLVVTATSTLRLNRSNLVFGARPVGGAVTPPQTVNVSVGNYASWFATPSSTNIKVQPAFGTGPGTVTVTATQGSSGSVSFTGIGISNSPVVLPIQINSLSGAGFGNASNFIGFIDQPGTQNGSLSGAIAVTGWALDDIAVSRISLYREPVPQDPGAAIVTVVGKSLVYIGDAIFLADTRPDVAQSYPNNPLNYRAGWGMLFLTNTTYNNNGVAGFGGNGTYILHVVGTTFEGYQVEIGSRRVIVDNAHALLPFGTIDTPTQGQTNVSGNQFVNFGWALTPSPKTIATDGSTMFVSLDGANVGRPNFGFPRADIDSIFPGYNNTGKAVGYYMLDTTRLTNGIHSIAWSVQDNAGALQGIGSRVFYVYNQPTGPSAEPVIPASAQRKAASVPRKTASVVMRRGPDFDAPLAPVPFTDGTYRISAKPGERLEVHTGLRLMPASEQDLPPCSTVDADGVFYWDSPIMAMGTFKVSLRGEDGQSVHLLVALRLNE